MIKRAIFLTILFFYGQNLFAMQGIEVLEVSSSGSSIVVDRGSLEGVREGQAGQFYYQSGTLLKPKLYFIGEAEVIKAHGAKSYWYFRKIENFQFLKKGNKIFFSRRIVTLKGRRKYKIRATKVLLPRAKSLSEYVDDKERGLPSEMVFKESEYKSTKKITETIPTIDYDVKQTKYLDWKKRGNSESSDDYLDKVEAVFIDQSQKGVTANTIRKALDKEIARTTVDGAVEKVNNEKGGLTSLYREARLGRGGRRNAFEKSFAKKKSKVVSEKALKRIKDKGPRWSADMEDAQLRRFFIKSGIAEEKERQSRVLSESFGHELNIKVLSDMDEVTTEKDPNNTGIGYGISFTYEIPLRGSIRFLESMTFEIGLEQGNTFYSVNEDINVRLKYGSFKGYLNWYFLNEPISIKKIVMFMGIGAARGNGTALSSELYNEYQISILSLPIYHAGIKYRFKAGDMDGELVKVGFGLGLTFSYEPTRYAILDTVDSNDNINGTETLTRFKVAFGLSAYF